jgi:hypothetical protein
MASQQETSTHSLQQETLEQEPLEQQEIRGDSHPEQILGEPVADSQEQFHIEEKDIVIFQEEQEATEMNQQEAYNEETGEINWDCPCLGPMVQPPCGEKFKEAFSCFVYSKQEPKGSDCIDQFREMQKCFQQYPDIYGAELDQD